jgi:hypothetical protein
MRSEKCLPSKGEADATRLVLLKRDGYFGLYLAVLLLSSPFDKILASIA